MSKNFIITLAVVILGLFGIFFITSKKDANKSTPAGSTATLSNNVIGENKKNVVIVEYGDYQCPACGAYHPLIKQLVAANKANIQFQFRNFPLQQIHKNARAAARAAEAAGKQNKFWEMHDLLYEQQSAWEQSSAPNTIFEQYAKQIGLNIEKYKTDFASNEVNDIINADFNEGTRLGVESTPTFFVQGKKLDNAPRDLPGWQKLIDEQIAASKQ
jgi:protein-disulfide isomerase